MNEGKTAISLQEGERVPFSVNKGLAGGDKVALIVHHFNVVNGRSVGSVELLGLGDVALPLADEAKISGNITDKD